MRRAVLFRAGAITGVAAALTAGAVAIARTDIDWAFPTVGAPVRPAANGGRSVSLRGSRIRFARGDLDSGFLAIDWWPKTHGPLPAVVRYGRRPDVLACGYCHLPDGEGRPENFALAGLKATYMLEQLHDIRSGERRAIHPAWLPSSVMSQVAHAVTGGEAAFAAAYFARQTFVARTRIVEAAEIPAVVPDAFVYRRLPGGKRETLGDRIVETPADFNRFELRDATVGYVAYVPPGAVARGRVLALGGDGGRITACTVCHGAALRGVGNIPPLAGRSPTQLFRQLAGFHAQSRHGAGDAPMLTETAELSTSDLIDLAAYAGSLK